MVEDTDDEDAGSGANANNSADLRLVVGGRMPDGRSAGGLSYSQENITSQSYSLSQLKYAGSSVFAIKKGSFLEGHWQVKTPDVLVDAQTLPSGQGQGFVVNFYPASSAVDPDGDGALFGVASGAVPFVSWTVDNPGDDGQIKQIRVTEKRATVTRVTMHRQYPVVTADGQQTTVWEMVTGSGNTVKKDRKTTVKTLPALAKVVTREILDGSDHAVSRSKNFYQAMPWGRMELVDEKIQVRADAADDDATGWLVTHHNYNMAATTPGYGRETLTSRSDGSWKMYAFEDPQTHQKATEPVVIYEPFGNGPSNPAQASLANCKVERHIYDIPVGAVASVAQRIRTEYYLMGVKVGELAEVRTQGSRSGVQTKTIVGTPSRTGLGLDGVPTGISSLRKTEIFDGPKDIALTDKPVKQVFEDGRADFYTYEFGDWDPVGAVFSPAAGGRALRTACKHSVEGVPQGVPNRSTMTITVTDYMNREVERVEDIYVGAAGSNTGTWVPVRTEISSYDSRGNLTKRTRNGAVVLEQQWDDIYLLRRMDENGIITSYAYDGIGRVSQETREGIAAGANWDAQPDLITTYDWDAAGRVLGTTRSASGLSETSSSIYDLAGRLLQTTGTDGLVTTYGYADGGRTVTTTLPGGGTRITTRSLDREPFTESGTAVIAKTISRSVLSSATILVSETTGPAGSQRIVQKEVDLSGRVLKERHPSPNGVMAETSYIYDNGGHLVKVLAPGVAPLLRSYDPMGEVTAEGYDLNNDGALTPVSTDRYSAFSMTYENVGGSWWRTRTRTVFTRDNDGTAALTSTTRSQIDLALGSSEASIDPAGNSSTSTIQIDRASSVVTSTVLTTPSGGGSTSRSANGLAVSSQKEGQAMLTHHYDALGRRTSVNDGRTGKSTVTHYDDHGRVDSVTDGLGNATTYGYYSSGSSAGRLQWQADASGKRTYFAYDPQGHETHRWGEATYPLHHVYNGLGQMVEMHTYQQDGGWTGESLPAAFASAPASVTSWQYHAGSGALISKTDASGHQTIYHYDNSGRVQYRLWARISSGGMMVATYYQYDGSGQLTATTYSDSTPGVGYSYDRAGRPLVIIDASGTRTLTYNGPGGARTGESISGGVLGGTSFAWNYDGSGRLGGAAAYRGGQTVYSTGYAYDSLNRLGAVAGAGMEFAYGYVPQTSLIQSISASSGTVEKLDGIRHYDDLGRLQDIHWSAPGSPGLVSGHDYQLDATGRRVQAGREDGTHWSYGYNDRGEVTSGARQDGSGQPVLGWDFSYGYDAIGNRTQAAEGRVSGGTSARSYVSNALNQYLGIGTAPRLVTLRGRALETAGVSARYGSGGASTPLALQRSGSLFAGDAVVANASGPFWLDVVLEASLAGAGKDGQTLKSIRQGGLYVAPSSESLAYDADGNMTDDARWHYGWDGENRLVSMETQATAAAAGVPRARLEFAYDSQSRRISKKVLRWDGATAAWLVQRETRFLWDGWKLACELESRRQNGQNTPMSAVRSYVWGLDVSGSPEGAGCVGGLLAVQVQVAEGTGAGSSSLASAVYRSSGGGGSGSITLLPAYDGNGNVSALVDAASGAALARWDYDPFGRRLTDAEPDWLALCPFGFSTKYEDAESGLLYYGYRYYAPELGRWLSRDPIGERGGVNLCMFVKNLPTLLVDYSGLTPRTCIPDLKTMKLVDPPGWVPVSFKWTGTSSGIQAHATGGEITWRAQFEFDCFCTCVGKNTASNSGDLGKTEKGEREVTYSVDLEPDDHFTGIVFDPSAGKLDNFLSANNIPGLIANGLSGEAGAIFPTSPIAPDGENSMAHYRKLLEALLATKPHGVDGKWVGTENPCSKYNRDK